MRYPKKIAVDHIKNDAKLVNGNQLYHNLSKDKRQRNDTSLICTPKMKVIMKILNNNKKNFHILLENLSSS